jgi:hypothetical protein
LNVIGDTVFSKRQYLPVGEYVVNLDAEIPRGCEYLFTTDETLNIENFGFSGPRLIRKASTGAFPYEVSDVMSIFASFGSSNSYYYFFDIHISEGTKECTTFEKVPAIVYISTSTLQAADAPLNIFPNPTNEVVSIETDLKIMHIDVLNIEGKRYKKKLNNVNEINISEMPSGVYILEFHTEKGIKINRRIVKM